MLKKRILTLVRKYFPALHKSLISLFYKILGIGFQDVDSFLLKLAPEVSFFIQIGANDGVTNDNINQLVRSFRWKGILIEPIEGPFQRLTEYYNDVEGLIFEKVAVSSKTGPIKMYELISETNLHSDQVTSLYRSHVEKHDSEGTINEVTIEGLSFKDLIEKHKVESVDLLMVDAEGYDLEILNTIDFEKLTIRVIVFEHVHVQSSLAYVNFIKKLKGLDYKIFRSDMDTMAQKISSI